ncbi:TPA: hypothetical protein ACQT2B_006705, partial [Pseudomonas aeruginosa]
WASTTRGSFVIAVRVDRVAGMPRAAVLSTVTRHLCLGDDFFPYVFWFSRWWLRQYGVLRWDSPTPGTSMPGLASGLLRELLKSGRLGGLAGGVLLACVEKYTTYLSWSIQNVLISSKEKPA